jgi:hypothetical protein
MLTHLAHAIAGTPPHLPYTMQQGKTGDAAASKRNEITRRSTPYAFPAPPTGGDGVVGTVLAFVLRNT